MMRNDYRRALILLRSHAAGFSGHVRLERRTLMGSMYFVVQAPESAEELRAVLVGRDRSGYFACALGEFRRDSRGQAVLSHSFDPRKLCGRELEQYQLVAVVRGNCEIVLSGNLSGSAELNWAQVRAAVGALCGAEEDAPQDMEEAAEAAEDACDAPEERLPEIEDEEAEGAEAEEGETEADDAEEAAETAITALGVDLSLPWPEEIGALRALFERQRATKDAPDDGFTYVYAPMPEGCGYAACLAGVRCEAGLPVAVRYALPSVWTAEPPAGLEDAAWIGDNNSGWWVTHIELHSGGAV